MAGELNASHVGFGPPEVPDSLRTGELGLVLEPLSELPRSTNGRDRRDLEDSPGREIRQVVPGGPAGRAGLRPGNRLLSVDGSTVGSSTSLERLLQGAVGRPVELAWSSGKTQRAKVAPASAKLARALVEQERAGWRREVVERMSRGRIGYIHVGAVDRRSLDALERELQVTQREKEAIVLDLRDNAGGDLPEEFLRRLAMPSLVQRQPRDQRMHPAPSPLWNRSIAVLIGPGTGSAAEVVAAGLAEMTRIILVGEPTHGAVIGADEIELLDGSIFRIPRIGWFTGSGDNLEGRGVTPDLLVAAEFEEESRGKDGQLDAAVRELLSALESRR
jgi:tricorn protease